MRTALVLMDLENRFVDKFESSGSKALLDSLNKAVYAARMNWIPVVFVILAFRNRCPDISSRNKYFREIAAADPDEAREGDMSTQLHTAIVAKPGDLFVTKRRVSAFAGSDLELLLRSMNVTSLVLGGMCTGGSIVSTVSSASDLDYEVTVLSDGCLDPDVDLHDILVQKLLPRSARVLTIEEWADDLNHSQPTPVPMIEAAAALEAWQRRGVSGRPGA